MFTGIITATAKVLQAGKVADGIELEVQLPASWKLKNGASVAINGTCLTVNEVKKNSWKVLLTKETLSKTSFAKTIPTSVNLELPLSLGNKLDGHIVQGHVDTTGRVISFKNSILSISYPKKFSRLLVPKGSVAVDGISLTVTNVTRDYFSVALIPYTLKHTTIGDKKPGELVNIEFDIIAKYIMKTN